MTLRVTAAGHETKVGDPIEWGTDDVEFRLQRAKGLVVEVVDRDGSPVTDYEVECAPCGAVTGPGSRVAGPRGPFAGGVATLGDVTSGRWLVCVYFASLPSLSFREIVDVPREGHRVVLTRDRVDTRVRVIDGDGRPVVGSDVQWCELFGETFEAKKVLVDAEVWRRNVGTKLGIVVIEGRTDARGEFVAPLQRGSRIGLRVNGIRHVPWSQDIVVAEDREIVVTVQRGARLVGRLLPPNALTLLRRYQSGRTLPSPPEPFGVRVASTGAGRSSLRPIEAAEDGTYVVEGLAAATCRLEFEWPVTFATKDFTTTTHRRHDLGIVTLSNQQEARLDIDLRGVLPGELEAKVFQNGSPFADQRCQLIGPFPPDGVEPAPSCSIGTDESGGFRVLLPPGRYCCGLIPPAGRRLGRDRLFRDCIIRTQEVVAVEPCGVAKATFTFAIGSLDVQVVDADGAPVPGAAVQLRRGEEWLPLPATKSDGHAIVDLAPGSYPLRATRSAEPATSTDWISAGDVVVTAANVTASSIRLAATAPK